MARQKRYSLEVELGGAPETPSRPPSWLERLMNSPRIRRLERRLAPFFQLRRFIPSRGTWVMLAVWIALALPAAHLLGCYLVLQLASHRQVMVVVTTFTLGLPLFIAPRFSREPLAWGIVLNTLALTVLGVMAPSTLVALEQQGDWAIRWVDSTTAAPFSRKLARQVTAFSRWGMHQVPVQELEELLGPYSSDGQLSGASSTPPLEDRSGGRIGEDPASSPKGAGDGQPADVIGNLIPHGRSGGVPGGTVRDGLAAYGIARPGVAVDEGERRSPLEGIKLPSARSDDTYWEERAATPDRVTLQVQEQRLWELINLERNRRGFSYLPIRADLCKAARVHSTAMRDEKFFSHIDTQGRSPKDRVSAILIKQVDVEELIGQASGSVDVDAARDIVSGFLRRPEDRRILLNDEIDYEAGGVGLACGAALCYGTLLLLR